MKQSIVILLALFAFTLAGAQEFIPVKNGKPKGIIIIPENATSVESQAATVLQKYLRQMSGALLPIQKDRSKPGRNEILIGNVQRTQMKEVSTGKLEKDGFLIRITPRTLIIAGGTGKGVLYGVYTLLEQYLGCRKYSSAVTVVPEKKTIRLPLAEDLQVPHFTFREVYYKDAYDPEYMDWHKLDCHGEIGGSPEWGFWCHSFSSLLPTDLYKDSHPEYFSYYDGKRHPGSQLCLTHPDVLEIVSDNLKKEIAAKPEPLYWSVSQNDNVDYCRCPACMAQDSIYGGHMGTMLPFVNKMAERFPAKVISTLAYQYTRKPPVNLIPGKNVNIMLCNIESPRHVTIQEGDTAFCRDLEGWGRLTDNIILWDYVIQFSNLLAPFPNLRTLQPNVRYFRDNRVTAVFEQGNRETGGDMAELRTYLLAKLLWNPDVNMEAVMNDFLSGYYGNAAAPIREYIDLLHNSMESSGLRLDIFGKPSDAKETFLSASLISRYNALFDRAESSVAGDPALLSRVKSARLPVYYAMLQIAREEKTGERGAFITGADGKPAPNPVIADILEKFHSQCKAAGVSRVTEWHTTPSEYYDKYKKFLGESGK